MFKGIAPRVNSRPLLPAAPHPGRTMHVAKKELMYVLKPFGGGGGKGLQRAQYVFFKEKFSPRTTCPQRVHVLRSTMPTHRLYIVCTNAPRARHGVLLLGASKHG